jgi:hypothetical protein
MAAAQHLAASGMSCESGQETPPTRTGKKPTEPTDPDARKRRRASASRCGGTAENLSRYAATPIRPASGISIGPVGRAVTVGRSRPPLPIESPRDCRGSGGFPARIRHYIVSPWYFLGTRSRLPRRRRALGRRLAEPGQQVGRHLALSERDRRAVRRARGRGGSPLPPGGPDLVPRRAHGEVLARSAARRSAPTARRPSATSRQTP